MTRFRPERVARQTKQVVSRVIAQELKDPRCGFVTVTGVKVAPDLKTARVYFSVLGSEKEKTLAQRGLEHARGFIQARLSQETILRYTPVIRFELDRSPERAIELAQKIDETVAADERERAARAIRARAADGSIPDPILDEIDRVSASDRFVEGVAELLTDLVAIDTTPQADLARAVAHENACFDVIDAALADAWGDEIEIELHPVLPEIAEHLAYTPPAYAAPGRPEPPPADVVYKDRANLVARLPRAAPEPEPDPDAPVPMGLALNAHIDTIPPHLPPHREGGTVFGRGACDDKGQVAAIVAALRLLRHVRDSHGVRLCRDLSCQFVIDEETGGNGSLSIAHDDAFPFGGIVVCEATDLRIYTANRGALWYRAELAVPPERAAEAAADLVLALENEGRALKDESDHPFFPERPVQTNHGVLGPFGSAPSGVNDLVELDVRSDRDAAEIEQAARRAVDAYADAYGDKTRETDPETGRPRLADHLTVEPRPDGGTRIRVHGLAGHMGSLDRCDNAITKAAYVVRELVGLRESGASVDVRLAGHEGPRLVLEGGQGFLPTHRITEVGDRLRAAARSAVPEVEMTFDKLHNDAFAREPDCALAVYAEEAARRAGVAAPPHPPGWGTSCDARIFADFFPDRDVIVVGPGRLEHAHGPDERIDLRRLAAAAKMLALLILDASGFAC